MCGNVEYANRPWRITVFALANRLTWWIGSALIRLGFALHGCRPGSFVMLTDSSWALEETAHWAMGVTPATTHDDSMRSRQSKLGETFSKITGPS